MELHYYTLKRLAAELSVTFRGARIETSYTQKKNELTLQLRDRLGSDRQLVMSTSAQYPFILSKPSQRRSKLSKEVLRELTGKKIRDISILPGDRIIIIDFIPGHYRLILQFFLKRTNFFIVDENHRIQEAFKQNKKYCGQIYPIPDSSALILNRLTLKEFTAVLIQHPNKTIFQVLKKKFFELNNTLLKEIEFRSALNLTVSVDQASQEQIRILFNTIQKLLDLCMTDHPRVYLRDNIPFLFSITEMKQYQNVSVKTYDSINEALTAFIFTKQNTEGYDKIVSEIKSLMQSKFEQLDYLIQRLRSLPDEKEQREYYQKVGELILAQMLKIPEGSEKISLTDLFDPDQQTISVQLDPELSANENAQQYFNKARRVAGNRRQVKQNLQTLLKQKDEIANLRAILQKPLDWKALKRVEKKLQEMHILQTDSEKLQEIYKPYKQYFYDQWEIWVGKSAKDNDDLTFKRAHKEDTWMHAQGVSGSHVVIRSKKTSTPIPPDVLFHAARLAAGNSRAKHSSYVPVIYTQVKYVRKPKGSAPGEVSVERIKSVFAEPLVT